MTKRPPIPSEQRSPKGGGKAGANVKDEAVDEVRRDFEKDNIEQTGDRANVRQNTSNQGYNQGR